MASARKVRLADFDVGWRVDEAETNRRCYRAVAKERTYNSQTLSPFVGVVHSPLDVRRGASVRLAKMHVRLSGNDPSCESRC